MSRFWWKWQKWKIVFAKKVCIVTYVATSQNKNWKISSFFFPWRKNKETDRQTDVWKMEWISFEFSSSHLHNCYMLYKSSQISWYKGKSHRDFWHTFPCYSLFLCSFALFELSQENGYFHLNAEKLRKWKKHYTQKHVLSFLYRC